jgi:RND family efflux transporter MFP subunit
MKKMMSMGMLIIAIILFAGCLPLGEEMEIKEESFKTVDIEKVEKKLENEILEYSGMINQDIQKNMSFKTAGKLDQIFVNEGDYVEDGQALGIIDTKDMNLQLLGLDSQLKVVEKEILKAKEALLYSENQYEDSKILYDEGAASKVYLESMALAYEQSRLNYEITQDNRTRLYSEKSRLVGVINDGTIYADQSGIVNSILFEESEYISPGKAVFIIGSSDQKIVIHVTRDDKKILKIGQKIYYLVDNERKEGKISFIDNVSDSQTSTYKVEIDIEEKEILTGNIVRVEVVIGKVEGIWIPIQCIQSTTIDFVYVIEDERSLKRSIEILEIKGDKALVEGLNVNENLVVSGMKSLVEGMLVKSRKLED